jgi:hypothetical protein
MWKHSFTMTTDVAADALWSPLVDIKNWGDLDEQIESIEIEGPAKMGNCSSSSRNPVQGSN